MFKLPIITSLFPLEAEGIETSKLQGGREKRRGRGAGLGDSWGGVVGVRKSSSLPTFIWRFRDCMSRFGASSCVSVAGGTLVLERHWCWSVDRVWAIGRGWSGLRGLGSDGIEGCGFRHWSALLVGSCEAAGCCEWIKGVAGV